jgi:hypothetical protein
MFIIWKEGKINAGGENWKGCLCVLLLNLRERGEIPLPSFGLARAFDKNPIWLKWPSSPSYSLAVQ